MNIGVHRFFVIDVSGFLVYKPSRRIARSKVYMENPIASPEKLLDLINEFGKTAGYKVNTQNSKAFMYTNNETAETEIRKKIPFDIARKIK